MGYVPPRYIITVYKRELSYPKKIIFFLNKAHFTSNELVSNILNRDGVIDGVEIHRRKQIICSVLCRLVGCGYIHKNLIDNKTGRYSLNYSMFGT